MAPESGPAVALSGVRRSFGDVVAVDDLTFEVPSGTVTVLLGPNGAGKTTVVRLVTGALHAHAGAVRTLDLDPSLPTVLYAPTWSPYSSLNTAGEAIIRSLAGLACLGVFSLPQTSASPKPDKPDKPNFSGTWTLDLKASTSLEPLMKQIGASFLERKYAASTRLKATLHQTEHVLTIAARGPGFVRRTRGRRFPWTVASAS